MGRQSARIYFNGQDHKEMVTWDGSKYVYHDKAYIWTPQGYELVWEKIYGLKLLYESELPFDPVSSENNKYIYFTENSVGSVIYRIKVNDKEPEREEHWTSDRYNYFTAPRSSRGFGIYKESPQYGGQSYNYRILNLEDGTYYTGNELFNAYDYVWAPSTFPGPVLTNQEVSPAESGLGHDYMSIIASYGAAATYQPWNFVYFIAPTGISAMALDNRDGDGTLLNGRQFWDIGRLNDGGPRGLLPRFIVLTWEGDFNILEYGPGPSNGYYSATVTSTPPFTINPNGRRGVVRDGKLPVVDTSGRIWIVNIGVDDITYTDTGFDTDGRIWDVSPDYKYIMTFFYTWDYGGDLKIFDMKTKKLFLNVSEEIKDLSTDGGSFVGHKCLITGGLLNGTWIHKYRLYKWR